MPSNFATLTETGKFVDKSSALQDLLQQHSSIHLLLRPRRSGKTTLLHMFHDFFESTTPDEQTWRKDLFKNNNPAFVEHERFESEFGKFPVIYLDFSHLVSSTMAGLQQEFKRYLTNLVRQLEVSGSFQNRDKLSAQQRAFLEVVLEGSTPDSDCSVLHDLSRVLHDLHQRRVVVLIDDYDTPTTYAVRHGYAPEADLFFHRAYAMLLKDSEDIQRAVLIGTLRVARPSWFSGLNNISVYNFGATGLYAAACMFTEDKTRALYDRQDKLRKLPFTFDDFQKWCDGYSTGDDINLFNSWSVSNALTKGELGSPWTECTYDQTIQGFIADLLNSDDKDGFRTQCETLLAGDRIYVELDLDIVNPSRQALWTWMYHAGYLKCNHSISCNETRAWVYVPNSEMQSKFRQWIGEDFVCQGRTSERADTVEEDSDSSGDDEKVAS